MADYDKVILPGQEGKIDVKIHGHKIRPGRFNKAYTVKTNDPENSRLVLSIMGDIKKVFDVSKPLSISGFKDEKLKLETIVSNLLTEKIHIKDARWSVKSKGTKEFEERIGFKLKTVKKGEKYQITVWNKKDLPPGHYMADLVLTTDFDRLKEKSIPVRITITPDVEVHPKTLHLGEMMVPEGTSRSFDRTFRVIATRGDSLKVLRVIPDTEDITINIKEIHPGKSYQGTIRVRPPKMVGRYNSSFKIITNYPGYEELDVFVKGVVRAGTPKQQVGSKR
ncbi:MAG: hypothetical protein JSV33_07310 [bacterium]|nr:MAG: hypothetical protein JSV33_07310 [bacterium]